MSHKMKRLVFVCMISLLKNSYIIYTTFMEILVLIHVIDGGFCKAYRKVTGIAGYTLIYNSYGLTLSAHEPFTSKTDAVAKETDIVSNRVAVRYMARRQLVGDTDTGHALKERIQELMQLLDAYRKGIIKEKK